MSRGHPFLIYRADDGGQLMLELPSALDHITIGRRPSCELALTWDDQVSRVHAQLVRMGSEWVVFDDGLSRNGTFVNGDRVNGRRRLRCGDVIRAGRTLVSLCGPEHASTAARTRRARDRVAPTVRLTPAQRRLLEALSRPLHESGYRAPASNREIAEELGISLDTVKGTLSVLFERFELTELPQNAKRAALVRAFSGSRFG